MGKVDLVVATGGGPMVKSAYSSGTPAYGVGAGNAVVIVDETADLASAAEKIYKGKALIMPLHAHLKILLLFKNLFMKP